MPQEKLSKMNEDITSQYWKYEKHEGTFYHAWWTCAKENVYKCIIDTRILKINMKSDLFLLDFCITFILWTAIYYAYNAHGIKLLWIACIFFSIPCLKFEWNCESHNLKIMDEPRINCFLACRDYILWGKKINCC